MGGCQNYDPFLGTLNNRCRNIIRTQKGTIILTTTHIRVLWARIGFAASGSAFRAAAFRVQSSCRVGEGGEGRGEREGGGALVGLWVQGLSPEALACKSATLPCTPSTSTPQTCTPNPKFPAGSRSLTLAESEPVPNPKIPEPPDDLFKIFGRNQRVSKPLALTLLSGMSDTTFFDLLLGHRRALHTGCQVGGGIRVEDFDGSVLRELLGVRSICSFARTLLRLSTRFQASVLCPGL